MGQREETTEELSERVLARLRREYSLVSSEVWVDDVHRVDFVGFRPARNSPFPSSIERGEFVFVEVNDPHGAHLSMSHDNGIDCANIPISYCPVCGRRLGAERKL